MKNILALLADWANGIFALLLAASISGEDLVWWYVPASILLAHVIDIDALPELLRRGKVSASAIHPVDHRTFLHYPIISVTISLVLVWQFGFWGWVVLLNVVLHLFNDLYGTGWGVPLLWPINKTRYKLLGRRVNRLKKILEVDGDWNTLPNPEKKLRFIVSWQEAELDSYMRVWGVDDWIKRWYLNMNWVSTVEYVLFAVAVMLLILSFN